MTEMPNPEKPSLFPPRSSSSCSGSVLRLKLLLLLLLEDVKKLSDDNARGFWKYYIFCIIALEEFISGGYVWVVVG